MSGDMRCSELEEHLYKSKSVEYCGNKTFIVENKDGNLVLVCSFCGFEHRKFGKEGNHGK